MSPGPMLFTSRVTAAIVAAAILILILQGCGRPAAVSSARVLFIGNSLTMTNNVPALVEALSTANGGQRLECRMVAFPGYSLEDHWKHGDAARTLSAGGWSAVVLQQGPSALPESRALLREYAQKFAAEARRVGATTALYMVWPAAERTSDFDAVKASYMIAAREVGGVFLPVGEAFRAVWRRDPAVGLYAADGFHPTPQASYLAALVIYQQLSGRSPVGMPSTLTSASGAFPPLVVAPDRARLLQDAAAEANASR